MIKNLAEVIQQLRELAPVLNDFKSEQVQLRIVERLFGSMEDSNDEHDEDEDKEQSTKKGRKRSTRKKTTATATGNDNEEGDTTRLARNRTGAKAVLRSLAETEFFKDKRTLGEIQTHCRDHRAMNFDKQELSSALIRLVKDGTLKRERNNENQFQYWAA